MSKLIIGMMLVSGAAHAGGLAVGEQNAVASGTAGASAGRTDDAGAAWYDPAALADNGGWRLGFSLSLARPQLSAQGADGTSTSSQASWLTPPHLDVSVAVDRWAAGVSVGVPFGGGVAWPTTWPGANESISSNLQVVRAAPFFAWSFGHGFAASVGAHADFGRLQLDRGLDFIDTQGDVKLDMDGRGYGVDASLHYQPRADLGLGLAYRGRSTIHFAGNANFTAPDAFSEKTPDQTASTSMTLPDTVTLGASYLAAPTVRVLADLEWANWSVNDATVVTFANPNTPQAMQENHWHDTVTVRAGTEYTRGKLVVRGGAYYDPSPVPAAYLTPTTPDGSRIGATLGASYRLAPAWTADAFGESMWILRRTTTDTDSMAASYGGTALVFGVGLRWTPAAAPAPATTPATNATVAAAK